MQAHTPYTVAAQRGARAVASRGLQKCAKLYPKRSWPTLALTKAWGGLQTADWITHVSAAYTEQRRSAVNEWNNLHAKHHAAVIHVCGYIYIYHIAGHAIVCAVAQAVHLQCVGGATTKPRCYDWHIAPHAHGLGPEALRLALSA